MKINPDSTVLQQTDGQWQKLLACVLWKLLKKGESVKIDAEDMRAMQTEFAPMGPAVFTHGHIDSIELSLVTIERALELAAYDKAQRNTTPQ